MDAVVCVDYKRMSKTDCTDAHAHLDLGYSDMAQGPFSNVVHHMRGWGRGKCEAGIQQKLWKRRPSGRTAITEHNVVLMYQ